MNVNELTSSLYGHRIDSSTFKHHAGKLTEKPAEVKGTSSFESILSKYAIRDNSADDIDVESLKNELLDELSGKDKEKDTSNVMNILTDAELAKEYLSSKSGRTLITEMATKSIASIITGNDDDN